MAPKIMEQSLVSALGMSCVTLGSFVLFPSVFLYAIFKYPKFALPVILAYYSINLYRKQQFGKGAPWPLFHHNFPPLLKLSRFFNFTLDLPDELKPDTMKDNAQFIFTAHPHGIVSEFRVLMDARLHKLLPKVKSIRALAASVLFLLPVVREFALWTNCIDASRASAHQALGLGHSLTIVPGGEHEQMLTERGKERVYLRTRKGFVRLAIIHGIPLVPVYVFGNVDLYDTSKFLFGLRYWIMKRFYVALPLCSGAFGLPAAPYRVPLNCVVGKPVEMPSGEPVENPSKDLVDKVHQQYIQALTRLFDDNKAKFGCAERTLEII